LKEEEQRQDDERSKDFGGKEGFEFGAKILDRVGARRAAAVLRGQLVVAARQVGQRGREVDLQLKKSSLNKTSIIDQHYNCKLQLKITAENYI
jgi:hypothetical protein